MKALPFRTCHQFVVTLLLCFVPATCPAIVVENFDTAPDPDLWILSANVEGLPYWDTEYSTGTVWLTDDSSDRAGSIFWHEPMSGEKFNISFDFWTGDLEAGDGGDGMTFAWVRGPDFLGGTGGALGFDGLDGYGVRFDTYSGGAPEPANYVAISRVTPSARTDLITDDNILSMEDTVTSGGLPALFHVEIKFDNGHLEMWMSNETASPSMPERKVFDYVIPGYVPYDAYFGFTGGTGGATNVHAVDNITINKGAYAGEDQVVTEGDTVTLDGSQSYNARSYHWQQIIVGGEPVVVLDNPNPPNGIAHFTAPTLDIGVILLFRLDIESPDGPTLDTVQIIVRAANAPQLIPPNIRGCRKHLGFRLEWDPVVDADEYCVGIKVGDGAYIWFSTTNTYHDVTNLTEGVVTCTAFKIRNGYGDGPISDDMCLLPMRNYALPSSLGGTKPPSQYVDVLSSGTIADMNDTVIEDDSSDSNNGLFKEEDYWGYLWSKPAYFDHVTYHTGDMTSEGGWFTDLTVQYTQDGTTWTNVPTTIYPAYDFTDALGNRSGQARFDLYIPTLRGTGIRIYGTPGGVSSFTSIAELEVFADMASARPLVVQGLDADVPERSTATLDGSFTFSTRGDITTAIWEQVSGPAVTIELTADPMVATFEAPGVNEDTLFVFKLTAGDGTETLSDEDVRITVRNLVTTAIAGPDRSVLEGTEATVDASGSLTTSGNISYQWTQTDGIPVTLNNATAAVCTFDAPVIWDYTEDVTLRLEVDDGVGGVSTDDAVIQIRNSLSAPAYDLGAAPFQHILHLGQSPIDRLFVTNSNEIDVDYLATFGGEATVNPEEGDAYDFTGTGATTTRPVMIWTPEYSSSGRFGNVPSLERFIMYWHIYILSPDQREARLHFANDDPVRGWNNGQLILSAPCCNSDATVDFTLHEGLNSMTFKLLEWGGGNYFGAGISDQSNVYYTDLKYAFGPAFLLEDAYAARELPASYEPGGTVEVGLSLRVNDEDKPSSVTISEPIPAGLTVVDAGGGTQVGSSLNWSFNGDDVRTRAVSYTLGVPGGFAGAVNFTGTISFAGTTDALKGDNIIYENPVAPQNFGVEMLLGAELSWSANPQEGIVGYRVFRSVNGQEWEELALVSGTSYTDTSPEPGSTYNYRVQAINAVGAEGPFSDPAGEKMIVMEIREAESFDYGGGQWPGERECPAAVEAPTSEDTGSAYDFFYANDIPPTDDRRNYRPSDNVGMYGYPSGDPGAVDSDPIVIGWITVGDWWKYTFNVPQPGPGDPEGGWVKIQLNVSADGTLELYWDDQLVGTVDYSTGGDYHTYGLFTMEEQFQTTPGEHTLRVKLASGGLNFNKIGIGFNWTKPTREDLFADDFEDYTTLYSFADFVAAGYTVNNGSGVADGAWRLWNTQGDSLGNESPALDAMTNNYTITDSDLAGAVDADEELITPNIDCTNHRKVRLDFNMNYRPYPDDTAHLQIAEVDVRSSDDGVTWGDWVNLRRWDKTTVAESASGLEQVDVSAYADGKIIQVRWHSYEANFDYWFAIDDLRVSGDRAQQPPPPKPIIGIEGDNVTLSWEIFGDGNYTVDYTDDLVGGSWKPVPGFTWPIQNTTWVGESVTGIAKRFYQVSSQ